MDRDKLTEPKLSWLGQLPAYARFYAVVVFFVLLLTWRYFETQSLNTIGQQLLVVALLMVVVLGTALGFISQHKKSNIDSQLKDLRDRVYILEQMLEPVAKDFDTIADIVLSEDGIDGQSTDSRRLIARAKRQKGSGKIDSSIVTLNVLADIEPNNFRVYSNLAYAFEYQNEFQKSIRYIDRAIDLASQAADNKKYRYSFHKARFLALEAKAAGNNELISEAAECLKFACLGDSVFLAKAEVSEIYAPVIEYLSTIEVLSQ